MNDFTQNDLPDWLQPVAQAIASVKAEELAPRFPHPPAGAKPAGVLMLFAEGSNGPELLLTQRTSTMRSHPGQISFPGGKQDDTDRDVIHTALRESHEEVGLHPEEVAVFGTLPPLWLPPSNHAVTTVMGYWPEPRILVPRSREEVEAILRPPIDRLLEPNHRFSVIHPSGWRGPAFDVGTPTPLWGFTAGVISRLFESIGWEKPWDESIERPIPGAHL